jgi:flavorubredoxin
MPTLLIVSHSNSGSTDRMRDAVIAGASDDAIDGVDVVVRPALDVVPDEVRGADAIILGTPEHFGYMSGGLKHFFDTTYEEVREDTAGTPYVLFVKAGNDGSGTIRGVESIATGLKWRRVREPLLVVGEVTDADLEACTELGGLMAAGASMGAL